MSGKIIVGLDIGTSDVCVVAAEDSASRGRSAEVLGVGAAPSAGMKKGVVLDMDATAAAIREAVNRCEKASGLRLNAVYIGVSGEHIECIESFGATGIKGKEVCDRDVERVLDSASTVYVPLDREVLHVLPTDFIVDGQEGIVKPGGMSGVRLEANVRVITASHTSVENLVKCCEKAGLRVLDAVFSPVASSRTVLRPYELDSGVVLVDVGGGTTDVAVFKDGTLRHAMALPVGGNHITSDIAIGLKISLEEAERIKRQHGFLFGVEDRTGKIEVRTMDGDTRQMPRAYLGEIIRPRCEEIMSLTAKGINARLLYSSPSCVVLTGGTSLLAGVDRLAEAAFGLPSRVGLPEAGLAGPTAEWVKSPLYSTSVGLMLCGVEEERSVYDGLFEGLLSRIRNLGRNVVEAGKWGFGVR